MILYHNENRDFLWTSLQKQDHIPDFAERVDPEYLDDNSNWIGPDDAEPHGECPVGGALVYEVDPVEELEAREDHLKEAMAAMNDCPNFLPALVRREDAGRYLWEFKIYTKSGSIGDASGRFETQLGPGGMPIITDQLKAFTAGVRAYDNPLPNPVK